MATQRKVIIKQKRSRAVWEQYRRLWPGTISPQEQLEWERGADEPRADAPQERPESKRR